MITDVDIMQVVKDLVATASPNVVIMNPRDYKHYRFPKKRRKWLKK